MMEWKSVFFRGRLGNKREIGDIGKEDIGERIGWKIVCLKLIMNNSVTLQFNMIKNLCRLAQKKKGITAAIQPTNHNQYNREDY